jgi:hypothetical protein
LSLTPRASVSPPDSARATAIAVVHSVGGIFVEAMQWAISPGVSFTRASLTSPTTRAGLRGTCLFQDVRFDSLLGTTRSTQEMSLAAPVDTPFRHSKGASSRSRSGSTPGHSQHKRLDMHLRCSLIPAPRVRCLPLEREQTPRCLYAGQPGRVLQERPGVAVTLIRDGPAATLTEGVVPGRRLHSSPPAGRLLADFLRGPVALDLVVPL